MSELTDRVILVTGSSSGIGEAVARRFADLGACVVVNSSSSVAAGQLVAEELGTVPRTSGPTSATRRRPDVLIDEVIDRYGRLDVLVNNAGWTTGSTIADLDALTDEIFEKTFDVNVFGTWWLTKAALPHLEEADDGNVVTITRSPGSDLSVHRSRTRWQSCAQPDDAAARQVARPDRFNAVAPGWWPRRGRATGTTSTPPSPPGTRCRVPRLRTTVPRRSWHSCEIGTSAVRSSSSTADSRR